MEIGVAPAMQLRRGGIGDIHVQNPGKLFDEMLLHVRCILIDVRICPCIGRVRNQRCPTGAAGFAAIDRYPAYVGFPDQRRMPVELERPFESKEKGKTGAHRGVLAGSVETLDGRTQDGRLRRRGCQHNPVEAAKVCL